MSDGAMQLTEIHIDGFKSFGETTLSVSPGRLYVVLGSNEDDSGVDSNGAGKTSFYEAIAWAILGTVPAQLESVDDVIHDKSDSCLVRLKFSNGFQVQRRRSRGGTAVLEVTYAKKIATRFGTARSAQEELNAYLGLDSSTKRALDDFISSVFLFVGKSGVAGGPLTNTTSIKERMDAVSRYLRLECLDQAYSLAADQVKELAAKHATVENQLESVARVLAGRSGKKIRLELEHRQGELLQLRESVRDEVSRMAKALGWARTLVAHTQLFDAVREKKSALKRARLDQRKYEPTLKELEVVRAQMNASVVSMDELQAARVAVEDVETRWKDFQNRAADLERRKTELSESLQSPVLCPHCKKPVLVKSVSRVIRFDKEKISTLLTQLDAKIKKIRSQEAASEQEFGLHGFELSKLEKALSIYQGLAQQINLCEARLVHFIPYAEQRKKILREMNPRIRVRREELREMKAQFKGVEKDVKEAQAKADVLASKVRDTQYKLGQLEGTVRQLESELSAYRTVIKEKKYLLGEKATLLKSMGRYSFWVSAFAQIRRDLVTAFLPALEVETNALLDAIESGMRIQVQLVAQKKSSEGLKSAFDILVLRKKSWRRLTSLSKGEATRVGMAISIALKKLAKDNAHSRFGWIMCDEVVDTLDASGLGLFFDMLASLPFQVFVVSHRDISAIGTFQESGAQVIQIVKRKGVSTANLLAA